MATTVNNLVQKATWEIGEQEWCRGGRMGFRDNKGSASTTGDYLWFTWDTTAGAWRVNVGTDGINYGTSLSITSVSLGNQDNRLNAVCQDSTGVAHAVFTNADRTTVDYARFTITRDGSGHVTGVTQVASCLLPSLSDANWNYYPTVFPVVNSIEQIWVAAMVSASTDADSNNRIGHIECTISSSVTPTATANWLKPSTGAAGYDNIYTGTSRADLDSHIAAVFGKQNPSSKAIDLFWGLISNETVDTDGIGNGSLYHAHVPTNGSNWGTPAITARDTSTSTKGPQLCDVVASATSVFPLIRYSDGNLAFGKVASDGTWTKEFLVVGNDIAGGFTQLMTAQGAVTADESNFWCSYVQVKDYNTGITNSFVKHAHYASGSWNTVTDSSGYITAANTATYLLPTTSQIDNVGNGIIFLAGNQGQTGSWVGSQFSDVVQVGGTMSYTASGGLLTGGSATTRAHPLGIQYENSGAVAYSASGGTTVSPAYPTGIDAAHDELILVVGQKPSSANGGTATTPSGWTLQGSVTGAGGYGSTLGTNTGNTNLYVYTKDTVTGSESGTLAVTVGTNNVCWAQIHRVSRLGGGAFQFGFASGSDTTSGNLSIATGSNPGITLGDLVLCAFCYPSNASSFSAEAVTATSCTFGTVTEQSDFGTTTGNRVGGMLCSAYCTTGPSTGNPTFTATAGGTTTNVRGPGAVLRIREAVPLTSSYTAAGGYLSGGAATESRKTVSAVAGGLLAGASATIKRVATQAALGGLLVGGAASISTSSAHTSSYTAQGGTVIGATTTRIAKAKPTASGGLLVGGTATFRAVQNERASGGLVASSNATCVAKSKPTASGGLVSGGVAASTHKELAVASGGLVSGGVATSSATHANQSQSYDANSGFVAGGSVIEKRAVKVPIAGGFVAGASALESRRVVESASGGMVDGGAASIRRTQNIRGSGGTLVGGVASETRTVAILPTGGSLEGGTATSRKKANFLGAGGSLIGGRATVTSSAPQNYYTDASGGFTVGGSANVVQKKTTTPSSGFIAGGVSLAHRVASRSVSGGLIIGGAIQELFASKRVAAGGFVVGGSAIVIQVRIYPATGGPIVGGSAISNSIKSGSFVCVSVGGFVAGGNAIVSNSNSLVVGFKIQMSCYQPVILSSKATRI